MIIEEVDPLTRARNYGSTTFGIQLSFDSILSLWSCTHWWKL